VDAPNLKLVDLIHYGLEVDAHAIMVIFKRVVNVKKLIKFHIVHQIHDLMVLTVNAMTVSSQ
jgi:hypothetical protein